MTAKELNIFIQENGSGDGAALNDLGIELQYADNRRKVDLDSAFKLFFKASELGNTNAMCNVAYCYAAGMGVGADITKAFEYYKKAAEAGDVDGMTNLGYWCYLSGNGTKRNVVEAIHWLIKAYDKGKEGAKEYMLQAFEKMSNADLEKLKKSSDSAAQYQMAEHLMEMQDYENAIIWYAQSAKNDDNTIIPELMNNIGMEFLSGDNGRDINYPLAYKFFINSAECGNVKGMVNASRCLMSEIGVEENYEKSFELCAKAAELGDKWGCSHMGWFYLKGYGVKKNIPEAIKWYTKAAEEFDDVNSMKELSHIYGEIEGYINYEQAAKWLLALIQKGSDPKSGYKQTMFDELLYENLCFLLDEYYSTENDIPELISECVSSESESTKRLSLWKNKLVFISGEPKKYFRQCKEILRKKKELIGSVNIQKLDPMLAEVARYVVAHQEGSTSKLQRAFEIGYNRAGLLIDQLEAAGIVGPNKGPMGREVLIKNLSKLESVLDNLLKA